MLISEKSIYFCKHEDINLAHECTKVWCTTSDKTLIKYFEHSNFKRGALHELVSENFINLCIYTDGVHHCPWEICIYYVRHGMGNKFSYTMNFT